MPDTGIKDCPGCGTAPGQSRVEPPLPGRRWRLAIPPGTTLISANDRPSHWAGRAAPTDVLRGVACVLARQQRIPPIPRARIVCYVRMTGNRRYDPGNYAPSAKACVDGIVDAKVLPDDSAQYVTGPDMRRGYPAAQPCIELLVIELPPPELLSCRTPAAARRLVGLVAAWPPCPDDDSYARADGATVITTSSSPSWAAAVRACAADNGLLPDRP